MDLKKASLEKFIDGQISQEEYEFIIKHIGKRVTGIGHVDGISIDKRKGVIVWVEDRHGSICVLFDRHVRGFHDGDRSRFHGEYNLEEVEGRCWWVKRKDLKLIEE